MIPAIPRGAARRPGFPLADRRLREQLVHGHFADSAGSASFEQDLIKQPAGILLHPMQSDPFIAPMNAAIEVGTEIVTFADSPKSNRMAYIMSDNLAEAKFAAEEIVAQVGGAAEYAVLENPGQSNHDLRVTALIDYMEANYPNMKLVGRQATNQDSNAAYKMPDCRRRERPSPT